MTITVNNLDQEETWSAGGGILGAGRHQVEIAEVQEGTSSGGHPQLEIQFDAVEPEKAGQGIKDWLVVIPSTYGKVKQLLEAAGIVPQSGEWALPTKQLEGKRLGIIVAEEPKLGGAPGEMRSTVKAYLPSSPLTGGNGATPVASEPDVPF